MKCNVPTWRSGLSRATNYLALAAIAIVLVISSTGCGADGKLFGRKPPPPPATMKDFLLLPRPE